jgi:membrane-bound metal-dependent hydrolase YbcI (DUF457 family)
VRKALNKEECLTLITFTSMFIGHFAIGLGVKKIEPAISLGTAFLAVQFLDLLWPVLVLSGIEKVNIDPGNTAFTPLSFIHYPYSHSMVASLFWSVIFALTYYILKKNVKAAVTVGVLVFSHWILDFLTHTTDLLISPWGENKVGLGLWNSVPATIIVEGSLFIVGSLIYFRNTKPINRKGKILLWSFLIFLVISYISNIVGPLPPSGNAVAFVAISMWLLVAWGYWIDKNRQFVSR